MTKTYQLSSILFRILYSIVAIIILLFNVVFSGIGEENDQSLVLPFLFCLLCIYTVTLFHKTPIETNLSKSLQIISVLLILTTIIGSLYLIITTLKNNGSIFALILCSLMLLTSITLIYFVIKNKKYRHYCKQ